MAVKDPNSHKVPMVFAAITNALLLVCYGIMIAFALNHVSGASLVPLVVGHIMLVMFIGIVTLVAMPGYKNGHKTFTMFEYTYDTMIFLIIWHILMGVLVICNTTFTRAMGREESLSKLTVKVICVMVGFCGVSALLNIYGVYNAVKPDKEADKKAKTEGGSAPVSNK